MSSFKKQVPEIEKRIQESDNLLKSYPDKLPVIVEPHNSRGNTYKIEQTRFLVPKLYSFHEFIFHLRRKIQIKSSESFYVIVGQDFFPAMNRTVNSIYHEYKDPDGFLYMTYSSQQIWGFS